MQARTAGSFSWHFSVLILGIKRLMHFPANFKNVFKGRSAPADKFGIVFESFNQKLCSDNFCFENY